MKALPVAGASGKDYQGPMSEFLPALALEVLREGDVVHATIDELPLAFYLVDGQPYCTSDVCTHEYMFLSDGGYVENGEVECPYHGSRFDVKTGAATAPPAIAPLRSFPVQVRDGQVYVAVD